MLVSVGSKPHVRRQPYWLPRIGPFAASPYLDFANGHYAFNNKRWCTFEDASDPLRHLNGAVSRAAGAMRTNSKGLLELMGSNVLRFDYDQVTFAPKGILLEGARTNVCLQSQVLGTTWSASNVSISSNAVVAPDGMTTADTMVENSASGIHQIYQAVTLTTAAWTWSLWAKSAGRRWLAVVANDGPQNYAYFDLQNGVIGTVNAGNTATITQYPNGWFRLTVTRTPAITACYVSVQLALADGVVSYAGDGVSGVTVWGAQVELGSFASSYIPTTTTSVTRAADSLTIPLIGLLGSPFSFRQRSTAKFTALHGVLQFEGSGNRVEHYRTSNAGLISAGGTGAVNITNGAGWSAEVSKASAARIANANVAISLDGGYPTLSSSLTVLPSLTGLRLSGGANGAAYGWLEQFAFWPGLIASDAELRRLSA